jgi:ethanolamine permease
MLEGRLRFDQPGILMRKPDDQVPPNGPSEIDQIVEQVASEARVDTASLRADEREYLKKHALKKPMGTLNIWALGVGVVITGEYFGWNPGLKEAGPIGMLIASLFVCALYMAWVLSLSELSVAMPFAGGPLAYGRRAAGPGLGFIMGWSMFLESLFAMVGTATASGGAVYFLIDLVDPDLPRSFAAHLGLIDASAAADDIKNVARLATTTAFGLITVAVFAAVQWLGAKEQAKVMEWVTYGAIAGLVWFWIACIPGVDLDRIFTKPTLVNGWAGVMKAIPFAIWWLVIIETVALAAEEAHEPHRTIPRGMALAQITLIVLVVLTWFVAAGAGSDYTKTGDSANLYPLQSVYAEVWPGESATSVDRARPAWHLIGFSIIALFGMVSSYNGMIYAVSRQSFSLGRAGYLPRILGQVHPDRRTPVVSIIVWSIVAAGFVVWGYFNEAAVVVAVLTCNLTALVWYVLAMICLFVLRKKEPNLPRPFKVPLYPVLPAAVIIMSLIAAGAYGIYSTATVLLITLGMYGVGLAYYLFYARTRLASAAPEELAARAAAELQA